MFSLFRYYLCAMHYIAVLLLVSASAILLMIQFQEFCLGFYADHVLVPKTLSYTENHLQNDRLEVITVMVIALSRQETLRHEVPYSHENLSRTNSVTCPIRSA